MQTNDYQGKEELAAIHAYLRDFMNTLPESARPAVGRHAEYCLTALAALLPAVVPSDNADEAS